MRRGFGIGLAVTLQCIVAGLAHAQTVPAVASQCAADKVAASGVYMRDVLSCRAQAAGPGSALGRECLLQAEQALAAAFIAAERGGVCAEPVHSSTVAARIDATVDGLMSALGTPPESQCTLHALTALGRAAARQHSCYAEAVAIGPGHAIDSACQEKASQQLFAELARVDGASCRIATGTPAVLDLRIRADASAVRGTIAPPQSSCTPIEVTTFHGPSFVGNSRLARIENNRVACMNSEDASIASCTFRTEGPASGEWLDSPQGRYALVGQAISLDGLPGGEYVVAARVDNTASAACVEPTSMDTTGLIEAGSELSPSCQVEEVLAPWNVMYEREFLPLRNWTDRTVCSVDSMHPDQPFFVRSYSSTGSGPDDRFCYTGPGAALNDMNGTERDFIGYYLTDARACHYLVSGTVMVPAAKRPATRTFPAPGSINDGSPIVWRPVSPTFTIANELSSTAVQQFDDQGEFQAATAATPASGELPNIGEVADSATVGTVSFSLAAGGQGLAIGAVGSGAEPDWYPLLPGHEIALGYENLQVRTATPVYALGFEFVEPNTTMPPWGGTPVDSTFDIVLYSGATEIGRTSFNAPDDQVTFVGVWTNRLFDRVTIVDRTGNDDDEYFGQFFTGITPR